MHKNIIKEYRSFQVRVAPGCYGGFGLLSGFSYFLTGSTIASVIAFSIILAIVYLDKPLKYQLAHNSKFLFTFSLFLIGCCFLPMLVFNLFKSSEMEFLSLILIPLLGISFGTVIAINHTETSLEEHGWKNIS